MLPVHKNSFPVRGGGGGGGGGVIQSIGRIKKKAESFCKYTRQADSAVDKKNPC